MGVSLERVQFKFASIIGELCNEPDVLSQFAVWLDLRLAEYKLKGNISLDCSGEEPDPIWLKGLNKMKLKLLSHGQIPGSSPSHSRRASSHHHPSQQISDIPVPQTSDILERDSSPEVFVVVKEEPSDVYPVGLAYNTNSPSTESRKRGAAMDNSPYSSTDQWSAPSKQIRLSQPVESPSNQSLMSVLSGYQGDTQESDTKIDTTSIPTTSSTSTMAARNTDSLIDTSGQFSDTSFNTSQTTLQDIGWVGHPSTSTDTGNGNGTALVFPSLPYNAAIANTVLMPDGSLKPLYHRPQKEEVADRILAKSKMASASTIPKQTLNNMMSSVLTFQRFLREGPCQDNRQITDLAPHELDRYLVSFYQTIKTPTGEEYKVTTKQVTRSFMDRYLQDCGYPVKLNSLELAESRMAYRAWIRPKPEAEKQPK